MADFLTPEQFANRSGIYNEEIQNNQSALQAVFDAIATNIRGGYDSRGDTPSSALQRNLAAAEAQQKQLNALSTFDFDAMMTDIGRQYVTAAREQQALAAKLAEDSSVSLFSDPVQAIINEFTLPWTRQELAGKNNQVATLKNQALELNSMMQNTASTYKASEQTMTAEIANDLANASRANIEERALRANAEAARLDIDKVKEAREADKMKLEAWKMNADQEHQKTQEANSAESLRISREHLQLSVDKAKKELEKEGEDTKTKQFLVDTVNLAIEKAGGKVLTLDEVGRRFALNDPYIKTLFESGLMVRNSPNGEGSIAQSPAGRLAFFDKFGNPANTDDQKELVKMNRDAYLATIKNNPDIKKDHQALADATQVELAKEFNDRQLRIRAKDETNPARPVSYGTIATSELGKTNPLWNSYVVPRMAIDPEMAAGKTMNFNSIIASMLPDIETGKLSATRAADFITDLATSSIAQNNALNRIPFFTGTKQTQMRYELESPTGMTTDFYKLTDKTAMEEYFVKKAFYSRLMKIIPEGGVNFIYK